MTYTTPRAAVIVPTHNRSARLARTLDALEQQTCGPEAFEVIVVANACTDDTAAVVAARRERAPYSLRLIERAEPGASGARNAGTEKTRAPLLIFLDDDIEASPGFVEAHLEAHRSSANRYGSASVAVGYLPPALQPEGDLFAMMLRAWWEAMFDKMRGPGHRFEYTDLLSGNFSLHRDLFVSVGGFDTRYRCHEDYELGYRLLRAGAQFVFAEAASGDHSDRSRVPDACARKRAEGYADVQLSQQYPELRTTLLLARRLTLKQKVLWWSAFHAPRLGDAAAQTLIDLLPVFERLGLRMGWLRILYAVFGYWYARGLADALPRFAELEQLLEGAPDERKHQDDDRFVISLDDGVEAAERVLDAARPMAASLHIAGREFGELAYRPGAERLAGRHMRQNLTTVLHREYVEALVASGRLSVAPTNLGSNQIRPLPGREAEDEHALAASPPAYGDASSR
jgi:GT2 family glycosyltransferase